MATDNTPQTLDEQLRQCKLTGENREWFFLATMAGTGWRPPAAVQVAMRMAVSVASGRAAQSKDLERLELLRELATAMNANNWAHTL